MNTELTCAQCRDALPDYVAGTLPPDAAAAVARHIAHCTACQDELADWRAIAALAQQSDARVPVGGPTTAATIWAAIQTHLPAESPFAPGEKIMDFDQRDTNTDFVVTPIAPNRTRETLQRHRRMTMLAPVAVLLLIVLVAGVFALRPQHHDHGIAIAPTVTLSPTQTATSAATSTPGDNNATPISGTVATSCANVLAGAGPAATGPNFTDLPLPANSVSLPATKVGGGGDGQFTIYEQGVCTSNTSTQAIFTFFANTLPSHNWPQQKWFPFDGYFYADCGDAYCWASGGNAPPRYVGLEAVTDHSNGVVSYRLRLATPPPAPTCDSSVQFGQGYYYNFQDLAKANTPNAYQSVPLPPLTRVYVTQGAGQINYNLCSAPSPATISSFMSQHLLALGWHQLSNNGWAKGTYHIYFTIPSNANWQLTYPNPNI